jgi:hypothetical protein
MKLVDITDWASIEIKTIELSQIFLRAPYKVEVREFVPREGDMLEEKWTDGSVVKTYKIPPYAIADMGRTAEMFHGFVRNNVRTYIEGAVGRSDTLLWDTYRMTLRHSQSSQVRMSSLLTLPIKCQTPSTEPRRALVASQGPYLMGRMSKDQ